MTLAASRRSTSTPDGDFTTVAWDRARVTAAAAMALVGSTATAGVATDVGQGNA